MKKIIIYSVVSIVIFVFGFLAGSFWTSMKFLGSFGAGSTSIDREKLSPEYLSEGSFWGFQYFGGMLESEEKLKQVPQGKGYMQVKMTYNQGPASGVKCKMLLNGKFKTADAVSDENGIISFRLPKGNWQVNSIQCDSWKNKPTGDFMLILPRQRRLNMRFGDEFMELRKTGKEVTVGDKVPETPQISLLINPLVELVWPDKIGLKQKATAAQSKIMWKPFPKATDYRVVIQRVTREERTTSYISIASKKISRKSNMPLSEFAHVRNPAAKEEYATKVEAYGENGEFLSESESFNSTFILTDGFVLIEDMHDTLGSADQKTIDSIYQSSKILDTVETLIKEKMYDQAKVLLNKVNSESLQGKKDLLTGYLYASMGDCKKARLHFDTAQREGENCIPDEYKGKCK